uniref:PA n=2 Tax=root TaxID=1 RepID=A0A3G1PW21_9ORTO|nr:PA [Photinus pyralis orthomyxo-like virus 1]
MNPNFYSIIYDHDLYPKEFILNFGVNGKHWKTESDRSRELSLRHDMVCILLCNLQPMDHHKIIESLQRKRKIPFESQGFPLPSPKKFRSDESTVAPSTSSVVSLVTKSSSSGSSGSTRDTVEAQHSEESLYRFWLIEGMPNSGQIQSSLAEEFGCATPHSTWDIGDRELNKFIEVKVSFDREECINLYESKKAEIRGWTSLVIINPKSGKAEWIDHPGNIAGESKVVNFIVRRSEIMRDAGIMDSNIQDIKNISERLFCSPWFEEIYNEWEVDWWTSCNDVFYNQEFLIPSPQTPPQLLVPSELLNNLSPLNEKDRKVRIKWTGKLIPEGFCHNIHTKSSNDFDMTKEFFNIIRDLVGLKVRKVDGNMRSKTMPEDILSILDHVVSDPKSTNFNLCIENLDSENRVNFLRCLGIKAKKRTFDPSDKSSRQPKFPTHAPMLYDNWFDEVLRLQSKDHEEKGYYCYPDLLERTGDDHHPIAYMCEKIHQTASKALLSSNAAVTSSKATNIYSRLGGSYLCRDLKKKKGLDPIAIMPIYARLQKPQVDDHIEESRLLSGVLVRGPNHAKSPTDRVSFITIELMKNNPDTRTFALSIHNAHAVFNDNFIVIVRQNSIMKEDCSYGTFNANAMFVPMNLIGTMLFENPSTTSTYDPMEKAKKLLLENSNWLRARYTEGVVMSLIGNSRDEGYFSCLRKLFMLLINWKNHDHGFCWDIRTFCEKMNECLVDNPLSMHLHQSLLMILQVRKITIEGSKIEL